MVTIAVSALLFLFIWITCTAITRLRQGDQTPETSAVVPRIPLQTPSQLTIGKDDDNITVEQQSPILSSFPRTRTSTTTRTAQHMSNKKDGDGPLFFHINYADAGYYESQAKSSSSALSVGGFDYAWSLSRDILDEDFLKMNQTTLSNPKGAGLWIWKPYVIYRALVSEHVRDGDFLFYSDSGSEWTSSVQPYANLITGKSSNTNVMLFSLGRGTLESMFSKPYARKRMGCTSPECENSPQFLASFLLLRKSKEALQFIREWLVLVQDRRMVSEDDPSFKNHRHDQSVLSLLAKKTIRERKMPILVLPDPSQWGSSERSPMSLYPLENLINHTRSSK